MPTAPPSDACRPRLRWPIAPPATWAALAITVFVGCTSAGTGPIGRWKAAHDPVLARPITKDEIGDDRNFLAKLWSPILPKGRDKRLNTDGKLAPPRPDPEAEAEFKQAEALFRKGDLEAAEKVFAKGAKAKKDTAWGEKFRFYLAETQYQRGRYVAANDNYAKLIADFPGTQFLDKVVVREFAIARIWLDSQDPKAKPERQEKWGDRMAGRLPMLDINGHGLRVLEHVRHHDSTGPLADDAILAVADYRFGAGDYEDASSAYDELITLHPKSEFLQRAQLGSIDSKMKAYIGPDYDSSGLEKAQKLIRQTKAANPIQQTSTADKLNHDLDLISNQQAEVAYRAGEFYRRTGKVQAAELHFGEVKAKWPKSEWAKKASEQLAVLAEMPRTQSLPSKIMTTPGSIDPLNAGTSSGSMATMPGAMGGGMGGMAPGSGP